MGKRRYSPAFERDWTFYTSNLDAFSFSGSEPPPVRHDPDGPDAKRAFLIYDSQGKLRPACEPDLLRRVLVTKASVNLHIKMWAEGLRDGTLWHPDLAEIKREYGAPDWVLEAVWRQALRGGYAPPADGLPTALMVEGALALAGLLDAATSPDA